MWSRSAAVHRWQGDNNCLHMATRQLHGQCFPTDRGENKFTFPWWKLPVWLTTTAEDGVARCWLVSLLCLFWWVFLLFLSRSFIFRFFLLVVRVPLDTFSRKRYNVGVKYNMTFNMSQNIPFSAYNHMYSVINVILAVNNNGLHKVINVVVSTISTDWY